MTTRGVSLKGCKRRKNSEAVYFEARIPGSTMKFYCTKIKSPEVGALCYDFMHLYNELGVIGQKRKAMELNYPEYSKTLPLEPLRSNFDIRNSSHKEEVMEIILKQAQAAAKNLPENLRRSPPVVGSPSPSNRSSSHQNDHSEPLVAKQDSLGVFTNQLTERMVADHNLKVIGKIYDNDSLGRRRANEGERLPPLPEDCQSEEQNEYGVSVLASDGYGPPGNSLAGARPFVTDITTPRAVMGVSQCAVPHDFRPPLVAKQDFRGLCTNQLNLQEISELSHHCYISYTSKVGERELLGGLVADINEDSGIIYPPEPRPNKFTYFMARFKQLMATEEKIPGILEVAEQGFKSEDLQCLQLRKFLEDHNLKVIGKILMKDDNDSLGRRRANEGERLPSLPEDCQSEEQNEYGVSNLASDGYGPLENPLAPEWNSDWIDNYYR